MMTEYEGMDPVRWLLAWGRVRDYPRHDSHPISQFLKQYNKVTVHFAQPFHEHSHDGTRCDLLGDCSFTFDTPAKDNKAGVHAIEKFHRMWKDLPGGIDNDGEPCLWHWRSSTRVTDSTDLVEFCTSPSFSPVGDLASTLWETSHRAAWAFCPCRGLRGYRNRDPVQG